MLNKPINPYPYHQSIDVTEPFELSCEIDYNKNLEADFVIYNKESGNVVASKQGDFGNGILSTNIILEDRLSNNNDYMWQSIYCNVLSENNSLNYDVFNRLETPSTIQRYSKNSNNISVHSSHSAQATGIVRRETYTKDYNIVYPSVSNDMEDLTNIYDKFLNKKITHIYICYPGWGGKFVYYKIVSASKNQYSCTFKVERVEGSAMEFDYVETYFFNESDLPNIYDVVKIKEHYYRIENYEYTVSDYNNLTLYLSRKLCDEVSDNDTVTVYPQSDIEYQESPQYYFRARSAPDFFIEEIKDSKISNPYYTFTGRYSQAENIGLNYVQFKLSVWDDNILDYAEIDSSDKIYKFSYDTDSAIYSFDYTFSNLVSGGKYRVSLIGFDEENGLIIAKSEDFLVEYEKEPTDVISFSKENNCVRIDLSSLITNTNSATVSYVKIFRYDCDNNTLTMIRELEAVSKGNVVFNTFYDYNVAAYNTYKYVIEYKNYSLSDDGVLTEIDSTLYETNQLKLNFYSTSLIGLSYANNKYSPVEFWNFELSEADDLNEVSLELSRNYSIGFGEYKTVSMGNLNSPSSSHSYFAGKLLNCEYYEPIQIKNKWRKFVNDETIKLLRSASGEIGIISIDSTSIKPIRNGADLARIINFSYTQIDDTKKYSIYKITLE